MQYNFPEFLNVYDLRWKANQQTLTSTNQNENERNFVATNLKDWRRKTLK